jgi:hypothetical protein
MSCVRAHAVDNPPGSIVVNSVVWIVVACLGSNAIVVVVVEVVDLRDVKIQRRAFF